MSEAAAPARLQSLDLVRGVAVLGILLLNIVAFGLPEAAYFNPRAYGGAEGADLAAWLINFILFDGKMRGLFSVLFGASMLMVIERAEAKSESPAAVHYRRMIWLLVFGLAHLWLVWWGDILSLYAPVGMIAYAARNLRVRTLVTAGIMLVIVQCALMVLMVGMVQFSMQGIHSANAEVAANAAKAMTSFTNSFGIPPPGVTAADLAEHRGSYAHILAERFAKNRFSPFANLLFFGWETLGYMLFGMAALKSGLLRGEWPRSAYRKGLWLGFGIGIPAYAAIAATVINMDFSTYGVVLCVMGLAAPVRPLMILGWACLILLLGKPGGALTGRVAAAGRMAFTNYLMTSLICTTFFYGYGFGWFGYLSRAELYLVVLAVWAAILLWSKPWLARFRYGPFEWAWRSLARGSAQPMKGGAAVSD